MVTLIFAVLAISIINKTVEDKADGHIFNTIEHIPHNKVGLLLGTGKYLSNGHINLYYKYRIEAAASLYASGKIEYILVSGDNSSKAYDEPTTIKNDLIIKGIPSDKIYLDYAGFRTLDSVVRCKHIFGQDKITIISQQFHNERALYIAQANGIYAVAYNARGVSVRYGFKTQLREKLARVKMIIDLTFGIEPHFLGNQIEIK